MTSNIAHDYKPIIYVPLCAIDKSLDFTFGEVDTLITKDGIECKIKKWEEIHICDAEALVFDLYGMDMWLYIRAWYSKYPNLSAMDFIKLELIKQ